MPPLLTTASPSQVRFPKQRPPSKKRFLSSVLFYIIPSSWMINSFSIWFYLLLYVPFPHYFSFLALSRSPFILLSVFFSSPLIILLPGIFCHPHSFFFLVLSPTRSFPFLLPLTVLIHSFAWFLLPPSFILLPGTTPGRIHFLMTPPPALISFFLLLPTSPLVVLLTVTFSRPNSFPPGIVPPALSNFPSWFLPLPPFILYLADSCLSTSCFSLAYYPSDPFSMLFYILSYCTITYKTYTVHMCGCLACMLSKILF